MADSKTYEESFELHSIAERLVERYFYYIGHVQLDNIYFAEIVGSKPKKASVMQIGGISSDWVRQLIQKNNTSLYCISVWRDEWAQLPPEHRQWLVLDALLHIDPHNDGKLLKPDVNEFWMIVKYLGPHWRKMVDLPSLMDGDPLPLPVPDYDVDEGETVDFEE